MKSGKAICCAFLISLAILTAAWEASSGDAVQLPAFGRDTVLAWRSIPQNVAADFVIRIAEFLPDRYLEWEDFQTQGTIWMPSREIREAKGYESKSLFKPGEDVCAKNVTTMWLSRKIFLEIKAKNKTKMILDGVPCSISCTGFDLFTLEVNKSKMSLPVIKIKDDRGSERWFLDLEENPLLVKHQVGKYEQSLISITSNKPDTLRFIKGRKLSKLPH